MKKDIEDKLYILEEKIWMASEEAIQKINNLIDLLLNEKPAITGKIKEASLKEIVDLKKFYMDCASSAFSTKRKKLKNLSNLEMDTIVREDFLDRHLVKLLVKYNELVYP